MIDQTLAHYRIVAKLGEGGMGQVWKAVDTQLDREVAIKLLPEAFAQDAERLARFEREAKLLASLNHPGIAVVHGLHQEGDRRFLVMELVPGEDLSKRLDKGPLTVSEALMLGIQIAEALEAAHAQSVIHRDLKPANVVVTPEGRAKVLDFGLAKAIEADGSSQSATPAMSPTITSAGTAIGMVLGTAAYMSPEQARGKTVDKRTDIWAFGCLLFEALTGRGVFRGETTTDSIGAILHKDPDWSLLPKDTPPTVRLMLRRCLTKNPDRRLHDVADARIELEQAIADPDASAIGLAFEAVADSAARAGAPSRTNRLIVAAGVVLALAVGLGAGWMLRSSPETPLRKFDLGVELSGSAGSDIEVAISPDGSRVAFILDGNLWVQSLDELEGRIIEDTEGAFAPFWSPDGEEIGYFTSDRLWKVDAVGGRSTVICELGEETAGGRGASWSEEGRILYSRGSTGVLEVAARGGEPRELIPTEEGEGDVHEPHALPGGSGVLFVSHPVDAGPTVLTLHAGGERRILFHAEKDRRLSWPTYSATGHILVRRAGPETTDGLWAIPFSLDSLETEGEPFIVVADAASGSVSRNGTLAFVHRPPDTGGEHLVWVDRNGRRLGPIGDVRTIAANTHEFSPDGGRLTFAVWDDEDKSYDAWVRDLVRGTETRLTRDKPLEWGLEWMPSGEEIVFSQFDEEATTVTTFIVPADGSGTPRKIADGGMGGLTPDGRYVVLARSPDEESPGLMTSRDLPLDIWIVAVDGSDEPRPILQSSARTSAGPVSPDGRYLVYGSNRSGRDEIYVTRLPDGRGRWQVSVNGGEHMHWGPRGDRLYFLENESTVMEVSFAPGDPPRLGAPVALFDLPEGMPFGPRDFTAAPDGERFVIPEQVRDTDEETARSGIKIVQNWMREFED